MYPRNAASPPRIVVGSIYQISDGAKQTSGASATVTPEGGSETAAAGSLACLGTSGEWVYTPTQAETNYTAFVVAVYKAGCTSASVIVITTTESTAGKVSLGTAGQQDVAQILRGTKGSVYFVAIDGNDGNDGLTPDTAKLSPKTVIEARSAGDAVRLGPGIFDLGSSDVEVPAGVSVFGAGIDATILTSAGTSSSIGAVLTPGTRSLISDLTVEATAGIAIGTYETGGDPAFTDAVLRRVKAKGSADSFYVNHSGTVGLLAIDCIGISGMDVLAVIGAGSGSTLDWVRGRLLASGTGTVRGIYALAGTVRCWDNIAILASTSGSSATGVLVGAGAVHLHGGSVWANSAGTINHLKQTGGTLIVCGTEYDRSKTSGTITVVSGLDSPQAASPTADSIAERIKTLDTRVPAEVAQKAHLVNGSGGITPPTDKGIWDVLGDGSKSISGLNDLAAGAAMTLTAAERNSVAAALLDLANGIETGKTLRQTLRIIAAVVGGKISGAGSGTETFRSLDDSADRAVVTVDQDGNRTAVSY